MASWKESLKIGEDFEKFVILEIKTKLALNATKNEVAANLKLYDIILENFKTIECKCDERAEETKNICIETHCDGKESGILTTTADYWMITDNLQGFLIKTSELKRCIDEGHTSLFQKKPTKFLHMINYPIKQEDGSMKLMNFYTIPIQLFSEYCVEVADINEMTYKELQ
jgi:hypothetical protein